MSLFRQNANKIQKFYSVNSKKRIIITTIIILLSVIVIERLVSEGTFLGYKVLDKNNNVTSSANENTVNTGSFACDQANAGEVSKILGSDVDRIGGTFEDSNDPLFTSVCTYNTKQKPSRSITIVVKDLRDEETAISFLKTIDEKDETDKVNVGDEAYYSNKSRQLVTRIGNRTITVTVSEPREHSTIDNKIAAIEITNKFLQ